MVNLIRRFQKPLLIVIVILVIISYVIFYNMNATRGLPTSDSVATIYGRGVTHMQQEKAAMRFQVTFLLRMTDVLFALGGQEAAIAAMMGQDPGGAAVENYIWNSMVLRHEAEALGVTPSEAEIETAVKTTPAFQTNGQFDYNKYAIFNQNVLSHRGFTTADLQDVIADQIRVSKVRDLIGATTHASPAEVREIYVQRNQKSDISYIRLKLDDFKAAVPVSDEDVSKLFNERQATLKTDEKRKVRYVGFTLAAESKAMTPKDRAQATQKLAERAQNLAIALTEKGASLESVAAQQQVAVAETPLFTQQDAPSELGRSEEAVQAAFKLTEAEPHSDPVSAENGYFVMELSGTEPSRPMTLEEAKGLLTEQIKNERAQEAMNLKASELRTKIDAELKVGKSLEEAAQTAGVTVEKLPGFSLGDRSQGGDAPESSAIRSRAPELKEGELSELVPTPTGGILVRVDKRLPIDEAAFEKEKVAETQRFERQQDAMLFMDWLRVRRNAAEIKPLRG